jgi:hypothetical protein
MSVGLTPPSAGVSPYDFRWIAVHAKRAAGWQRAAIAGSHAIPAGPDGGMDSPTSPRLSRSG